MLKEAVASKAAKLLMTCVCPVAGTTALSLSVPQARDAVYKATQPRQYAKPKTRVRAQAQQEAGPVQLAQNEVCPPSTPFRLADLPPVVQAPPSSSPPPAPPPADGPPPPPAPPTDGPPPFVPPTTPMMEDPPGVPEPSTWLQLILGFGLIGGVARVTYRRNGSRPAADRHSS